MKTSLVDDLLDLHKPGTLHVMDRGEICGGCGGQWPCATRRLVERHALDALRDKPTDSACDGSSGCPVKVHKHGCFADRGNCDDLADHELTDSAVQ